VPATVYAESTPNPNVQKYVANKKLVLNSLEYKNLDDAVHSPLASALFQFPFIKEVFFDDNYVSITKYNTVEWNDISNEIREFLRSYLEDGKEIVSTNETQNTTSEATPSSNLDVENLDDISKQIVDIIEEYVKPAVASDGGNIQFQNYDPTTQKVEVILQGACSGCPSSTFTLKNGIETMLKEMLPGKIATVEAING